MDQVDFFVNGATAIVTGAAQGIGFAIADVFSRQGVKILLLDIDDSKLQQAYLKLHRKGRQVQACLGDVTQESDLQDAAAKALETWGRIDVLVNNAGIGGVGKSCIELTVDEWRRMLEVDLTGVFLACRAVIPSMVEQQRGSIINIASITGQAGIAGSTHYAAAKAGVIGFSKSLASELAPHKVNVNVIAPGLIDTRMSRARGIEHQRGKVIWPRIGTVEDIAWAAAYLASPRAEFITGTVLNVNGGAYMG
jgi:NAD(P)-dependent dehydrogenase (short-subunit alcohol dehydrogenase family)